MSDESLDALSMPEVKKPNGAFSTVLPTLQLLLDSTSLGELKKCPRSYQLSIIEGWQPKHRSVHLTFGLIYHSSLERYDHARAEGLSHEKAQRQALHHALVESQTWESDDPNKNRSTLVRSVVWYLEQFRDDPLQTVILASGKPAVELSFRFELEREAPTGEIYMLCGHLDRVATLHGLTYIVDRKTSKQAIDQRFFDGFSPDNQFSLYSLAAKIMYSLPVVGLIVDGVQVAVGFSRYQRGMVLRTEAQLNEWLEDLGHWITVIEQYAEANYWPMNDKACFNCQFRKICSKSPGARAQWLEADFTRRTWDPSIPR